MNMNNLAYILDLDQWEILYYLLIGESVLRPVQDKTTDKYIYDGSLPDSLDRRKLWEQSKANGCPDMQPFEQDGKLYVNSIINVTFSRELNGEIYSRIAPKAFVIKSIGKEYEQILHEFQECYKKNQEDYKNYKTAKKEYAALNIQPNKKNKAGNQKIQVKEKIENCKSIMTKSYSEAQNKLRELLAQYAKNKMNKSSLWYSVRALIYHDGFKVRINDNDYSFKIYKRSPSKAKQGKALFIWNDLFDEMVNWNWIEKPIRQNTNRAYDLTSIKAYETLVNSSIIGTVSIKKEEILLIDSIESDEFSSNRWLLKNDNGELLLEKTKQKKKNVIWDGQALLDKSVFERAGTEFKKHGMMLLRNRFFKACAFNTNIQSYYQDKAKEKNTILGKLKVIDAFGREINAANIKMIVTTDSLKYLKFTTDLGFDSSEKAYDYWLDNLEEEFGIVKTENASHYGNGLYHEAGYQILNTLPLSKDDMKKLMNKELEYIKNLYEDDAYLLYHVRNIGETERKKYFVYTMAKYCKGFEKTDYYKAFRREIIGEYIARLKNGKIKTEGDFYVLCSMPMEMLAYSLDRVPPKKPFLKEDQAYIPGMDENEQITLFRYPHMSSSSVCVLKNHNPGYMEYFNFIHDDVSNIVILSPWNSNIMTQLGGADFDSDVAFLAKNEVIKNAAHNLPNIFETFKTLKLVKNQLPVAEASDELKGSAKKTPYEIGNLYNLDHEIAESGKNIGSISNNAQLLNSYFWQEFFGGKNNKSLETLYDGILKLSVLNELEIDRSKHKIELKTPDSLKTIMKGINPDYKNNKPAFLQPGQKDQKPTYWECPVDYIGLILDEYYSELKKEGRLKKKNTNEEDEEAESTYSSEIEQFFRSKPSWKKEDDTKRNSARKILAEAAEKLKEIDKKANYGSETSRDDEDENARDLEYKRNEIREECMKKLMDLKTINEKTTFGLIMDCFKKYKQNQRGKDGKKKGDYMHPEVADPSMRYKVLGLLFKYGETKAKETGKNVVLECLNSEDPDFCRETLEKSDNGDIDIWGTKVQRVTKKSENYNE